MRKAKKAPNAAPKRMHPSGGRWYWKPERRLRPSWKTIPLGEGFAAAAAEARRLNQQVDEWLAKGALPLTPRQKRRTGPTTVSQLASEFRASPAWKKLRPRTAYQYIYEFKRLEAEFGHEPAATLSEQRVDEWIEELQLTAPETARHVAAKGRLLFKWAGRKGLIPRSSNPFMGAAIGQGKKRKVRITADDLKILVAACDIAGKPSIGTALVIGFAAVQRITDCIALTDAAIEGPPTDRRLRFTQSKSAKVGARGALEPGFQVDMALPAMIAQRLATHPPAKTKEGFLIVSESTGT
ncbi:MAG: hypothetical protein KGL46_14400, partial [Hyphomicrobiales bacterium]|nr:hypothetical protein [Hyphomicrobiales bacterium]